MWWTPHVCVKTSSEDAQKKTAKNCHCRKYCLGWSGIEEERRAYHRCAHRVDLFHMARCMSDARNQTTLFRVHFIALIEWAAGFMAFLHRENQRFWETLLAWTAFTLTPRKFCCSSDKVKRNQKNQRQFIETTHHFILSRHSNASIHIYMRKDCSNPPIIIFTLGSLSTCNFICVCDVRRTDPKNRSLCSSPLTETLRKTCGSAASSQRGLVFHRWWFFSNLKTWQTYVCT